MLREERQILRRQLVLQRLGRRGDDDRRPGLDRRYEVGQGLAGAGSRLDDEVTTGADRIGDTFRHLDLTEPGLGAREGGGHLGERDGDAR